MARFSERIGVAEVSKVIQIEGMSDALRNSIWNFMVALFDKGESGWWYSARYIAQFFMKVPLDEVPSESYYCRKWLRNYYGKLQWYEVYDLVEFVSDNCQNINRSVMLNSAKTKIIFNNIFEEELSGFRFISGQLVPISNPAEVASIDGAIDIASRTGLAGAHAHIVAALQLLAKRPDPDYRNSIKESISAVESIAKQLGSNDAQGLTDALGELSKKVPIHGALRAAFIKLYGYSSDESGIRHAMLDEPNIGYDEAKYMAVACSAFVNYIATKAQASGLLRGS